MRRILCTTSAFERRATKYQSVLGERPLLRNKDVHGTILPDKRSALF